MKKLIIVFLFSFCFSSLFAQKDAVKQDQFDKVYDANEELSKKIKDIETKYKHDRDSIEKRIKDVQTAAKLQTEIDSLRTEIKKLQQDNKLYSNQIVNLNNAINADTQGQADAVKNVDASNDLLVGAFQGAVYYPIRSKYNPQLIADAIEKGQILADGDEGLKKSYIAYKPVLEKYGDYNADLIKCFTVCASIAKQATAKAKNWPETDSRSKYALQKGREAIVGLVHKSQYYREVHSNSTSKRIPYLRQIMEDFQGLSEKEMTSVKVYEFFIKKLEPNK